jgi:hypothetical protein
MKTSLAVLVAFLIVSAATTLARADTVFFDDFNSDSGASSAWSNTLGNWTADGGVYRAQSPSNFANARPHRRCWPAEPALGWWGPSRLVATAAQDRLRRAQS